jgi:fructokinase
LHAIPSSGARTAVVFGEVLVDVYPDEEVVAGALLHVAAHLVALGWTTHFVTRIGDDPEGARVRSVLAQHRLDGDFLEIDPELPTGRVTVHTHEGENRFTIHRPAAWDAIDGRAPLPEHAVFCYGTLAARSQVTRSALQRYLSSTRAPIKALDMNLRPPDCEPAVLGTALRPATLLKLNEEELTQAGRILGIASDPSSYFGAAPSLQWLCVTQGSRGAALYDRAGRSWSLAAAEVEVTDTVGAGDAFMAGLVDALARGQRPDEALAAANNCAVSVLRKRGGLPDVPRVRDAVQRPATIEEG